MAHDFSDEDLDDLPLNTLDELENNAIQFTQRQQTVHKLSSDYGDDLDDEAFGDATVVDVTNKEPIANIQPSKILGPTPTTNEHFRLSRYASSNNSQPLSAVPSLASASRTQINDSGNVVRNSYAQNVQLRKDLSVPHATGNDDGGIDQMRKQIEDLMKEREQLKQQVTAKSGEIAIVRTNQEKAIKEYERQLNTLKHLNAEELSKQNRATEIARDAERSAATELEFAKRDLAEEGEKIRNLKRAKDKGKPGSDLLSTPKKIKTLPHRDGFDDDEIQIISPSKWQSRRSNPSTPTKTGNKRKRKGVESPIAALDLVQGPDLDVQPQPLASHIDPALLEKLGKDDHRLDFLQSMLSHRPYCNHLRTIEEFGKYCFPSNPRQSFSSAILDMLPALRAKDMTNFSIEFCEILISLWSKCLVEKYYAPLYLIVDLLTFALELRTLQTAPFIIDTLLPVIQDTICLLAVPRFKREPPPPFSKEIEMIGCLTLLHLVALGCVGDREHIVRFWRFMRLEFVLMILSNLQTMEDLEIMLPIMSTSALSDSIGPVAADTEAQKKQAEYILDRVTYLLFEKPAVAEGKQPPDRSRLLHLRLQLLSLLDAICRTTYGAEAMTAHPLAIGRLAKLMSDELDIVYDYQAGFEQSAQIVCFSNRLLHHLVTKYEKLINMQKKLQPIHGGVHKYLTSLARLAFNEDDLIYGAGVDPEVSLCAREMLEALVTPEEGEAIYAAFASP